MRREQVALLEPGQAELLARAQPVQVQQRAQVRWARRVPVGPLAREQDLLFLKVRPGSEEDERGCAGTADMANTQGRE